MNTDKLKFIGTCLLSISIIYLATALFSVGFEASKIRQNIPAILSETDKILTALQPMLEKDKNGNTVVSDVMREASKVRRSIPGVLAAINNVTTEIRETRACIPEIITESREIRSMMPDIMARVDNVNHQIPDILGRVDNINQQIPLVTGEMEAMRKEIPITLDRTEQLIAAAYELSEHAGKKAGKGAAQGAIKGVIGLPLDTTLNILKSPARIITKPKKTDETSEGKKEE
ncbi:MAG: hypothetical protein MRJ65_00055 [Candidatus Brocadiaceae bacterium]|nr:hypothetical protein [Candidatus Brocadiaceae bacterium]